MAKGQRLKPELSETILDGENFYSLQEAKVVVGEWVKHYSHERPHSALGY
jgi:putative transposase